MIVTYDYYTTVYKGTYFTNQTDFERMEAKAELVLNQYVEVDETNPSTEVKSCICALSEAIDNYTTASAAAMKGHKSESVAGYSVSYGSSVEIKAAYKQSIRDTIALYLGNDALYRGVGRHVL